MPNLKRSPQQPVSTLATVGEFWQWAMSDLLNNANHGILAEFMVGKLLGLSLDEPRIEGDAYDLLYRGFKIEVKSSAYIQSWHTDDSTQSAPSFTIGKRLGWDAASNSYPKQAERSPLCVHALSPMVHAWSRCKRPLMP